MHPTYIPILTIRCFKGCSEPENIHHGHFQPPVMSIIWSLLSYYWLLSIVRKSHTMMPAGITTNPCYLTSAGLSRLLGNHLSLVDSNSCNFYYTSFLLSPLLQRLQITWESKNHVIRIASTILSSTTIYNILPSLSFSSSFRFFSLPWQSHSCL